MCRKHCRALGGCPANHVVEDGFQGTCTAPNPPVSQHLPSYPPSTASSLWLPAEPGTSGAFVVLQPSAAPSSAPPVPVGGDEVLSSNRTITPTATQVSLQLLRKSTGCFASHMSQPFIEQYAREENQREDKQRLDEEWNKRRTEQSVIVYPYKEVRSSIHFLLILSPLVNSRMMKLRRL